MELEKIIAPEEKKPATFLNLVHIALDTYDDIFSDFDASPYSTRILSDDFLKEVQKRYVERKRGGFEIRFTLPKALRNAKTETLIKKRLKDYFELLLKNTHYELKKKRIRGWTYIGAGFVLLASQLYLAAQPDGNSYIVKLLEILMVPAGWYGMFVGIENILETPAKLEDQQKFYERLKNANYLFMSEEDIVQQINESAVKTEEAK
ncbi:MAG: hypothetical protein V1492_03405 [Candidatus Micrarchaeota archaeon]